MSKIEVSHHRSFGFHLPLITVQERSPNFSTAPVLQTLRGWKLDANSILIYNKYIREESEWAVRKLLKSMR